MSQGLSIKEERRKIRRSHKQTCFFMAVLCSVSLAQKPLSYSISVEHFYYPILLMEDAARKSSVHNFEHV